MPLNIDFVQILLHMLNFVILAGGLTLLLFNPVRKFIEKRQQQFEARDAENRENALKAESARAEYEQKLAAFENETEAIRLKIEQEAADTAKAYIDSAKAEADAIVAKAEADAEKRKEQILDSAQTEIGELVISAAQKLLADTATPERTQELYDAFIEQASGTAGNKAGQSKAAPAQQNGGSPRNHQQNGGSPRNDPEGGSSLNTRQNGSPRNDRQNGGSPRSKQEDSGS